MNIKDVIVWGTVSKIYPKYDDDMPELVGNLDSDDEDEDQIWVVDLSDDSFSPVGGPTDTAVFNEDCSFRQSAIGHSSIFRQSPIGHSSIRSCNEIDVLRKILWMLNT
jgi:hypothetical protein